MKIFLQYIRRCEGILCVIHNQRLAVNFKRCWQAFEVRQKILTFPQRVKLDKCEPTTGARQLITNNPNVL